MKFRSTTEAKFQEVTTLRRRAATRSQNGANYCLELRDHHWILLTSTCLALFVETAKMVQFYQLELPALALKQRIIDYSESDQAIFSLPKLDQLSLSCLLWYFYGAYRHSITFTHFSFYHAAIAPLD